MGIPSANHRKSHRNMVVESDFMGFTIYKSLVGGDWNMTGLFVQKQLEMSSSQLTQMRSYFSEGLVYHQPDNCFTGCMSWYSYIIQLFKL